MPRIDFPVANIEPYWIDAPEREASCEGCGCHLICGDKAFLDINTFVIGCCIPCIDDQNRRVAEHFAELKCIEANGKSRGAAK